MQFDVTARLIIHMWIVTHTIFLEFIHTYTDGLHMHPMCTLAFDLSKVSNEVNVSELVMLRMCLAEHLSLNPDDYEAEQQLREVEFKVDCWLHAGVLLQ